MPWYKCTVNEVGPAIDATDTPAPVIYLNLTDQGASFTNTWFYAGSGGQTQMLAVGIAAVNGNKSVEVAADAHHAGNSPFTAISRMYLLKG